METIRFRSKSAFISFLLDPTFVVHLAFRYVMDDKVYYLIHYTNKD